MTPSRATAVFEGQSSAARRVYQSVPSSEPLALSKIHGRVSRDTNQGVHVTKACLGDLVDAGLVRQVSKDRYQRKEEVPGTVTLESLSSESAPKPTLGDLMRPVYSGTNHAQPIPAEAEQRILSQKPSALEHMKAPPYKHSLQHLQDLEAQSTLKKVFEGNAELDALEDLTLPCGATMVPGTVDMNINNPGGSAMLPLSRDVTVPADPLAQMAELAGELLDVTAAFGTKIKSIAARLENVALDIEAERVENSKAAKQLEKFRSLLNDAGE